MKNKFLFMATALVALLAGCTTKTSSQTNPSTSGTAPTETTIKVWCAENAVNLTTSQLEGFKEANPTLNVTFDVQAQGEGDAASAMVTDVEAGADVFCFPQDQLARLVSAGALAEVRGSVADSLKNANDAGSVKAATLDEKLYAYPLTSDNGYFMYYDKTVVKEESIDDLAKIIDDVKAANKLFSFQLATDGAWYNAGFFFGAGAQSIWTTNSEGKFTEYKDTYNSAQGLIAAQGMASLIHSGVWNNASSVSEFNANSAVVVSGTWDYTAAVTALGDNLGIADLPSFTVDGNSYHLGSFSGNKLMGVKPQADATKAAICQLVAEYLTGETAQLERFNELAWGPSNKVAQNSDAVKANPALVALNEQAAYAVPQGQYPGDWWNLAAAIGSSIQEAGADVSNSKLQEILTTYNSGLAALLNA